MAKIRVLVVEDSVTTRKRIVEVLGADADMEIIGEAGDGSTAVELSRKLLPDVITMDVVMPRMTGVTATELIMAYHPTRIVVVSAAENRGEAFDTFDALAAGAIEAVEKPTGEEKPGEWEKKLRAAVRIASRIPVITHPRARLGGTTPNHGPLPTLRKDSDRRLVALGASTGGPAALLRILRELPRDFSLPILTVLHIGATFSTPFTEWLRTYARYPVETVHEERPLPAPGAPCLLLAPADRHLVIDGRVLRLDDSPERNSVRPSIDMLFESVADHVGAGAIGCLLTGMGRDGARGLRAIRSAGGATIAQDEATSVVFGMPAEAVRLGAAEQVLPISEIAAALNMLAKRSPQRGPS